MTNPKPGNMHLGNTAVALLKARELWIATYKVWPGPKCVYMTRDSLMALKREGLIYAEQREAPIHTEGRYEVFGMSIVVSDGLDAIPHVEGLYGIFSFSLKYSPSHNPYAQRPRRLLVKKPKIAKRAVSFADKKVWIMTRKATYAFGHCEVVSRQLQEYTYVLNERAKAWVDAMNVKEQAGVKAD